MDLNSYRKKIFSQYTQDGILEKIFDIIGTTNKKYFVEFGSSGVDSGLGNTAYLRRLGFSGLLMDGSERPYNGDAYEHQYPVQIEFISASNINSLFEKYNVPNEFDLLSIDIDGQDFHVWHALDNTRFMPRVVAIEMCHHILPGVDRVMRRDDTWVWRGNHLYGASITALKQLGIRKGYSLVATCLSDAILVRNDLAYDDHNKPLFKDMNDEFALVAQDKDLIDNHMEHPFNQDDYAIPYFLESRFFLDH